MRPGRLLRSGSALLPRVRVPRSKGSLPPRSRTRSSGDSPRTTKPIASRKECGPVLSSGRASNDRLSARRRMN